MEPSATHGHLRPAVKVKMEVKEEPEYIYVDETVSVAATTPGAFVVVCTFLLLLFYFVFSTVKEVD